MGMKRRTLRWGVVTALVGVLALALSGVANASLTLNYVFNGNGGYSADGLGQNGTGGTLQADVPAGSTVNKAFLYGTYYFDAAPTLASRTIDLDGTMVETTQISGPVSGCCQLSTTRAEVTAQVAAKVGGGGGITNFAVNTDPATLDGVALVVIYSNPGSPDNTIAILDGSASTTGDTATFLLADPLDKTVPGFQATMSLGSGFSFQGAAGNVCGGGQFSIVEVNSQLMSSCAGNYDDGVGNNGGLITVGGVGDSTTNPTLPNPAEDDELYNLDPFLAQGATNIEIKSSNPSDNDNLFLAVISITADAQVSTEDCDNGIDDDGDGLIDGDDPDCQVAPPDGFSCGEVRGDGRLSTNPDFRYVLYNVKRLADQEVPSGEISFTDLKNKQDKKKFVSTSITTFLIDGNTAVLEGEGMYNGTTPVTYRMVVTDGSPDTFSIVLSNGYSASGNVTSGRGINIKSCEEPT
jgi:hypothetical protein